jgi:hypothetical protein
MRKFASTLFNDGVMTRGTAMLCAELTTAEEGERPREAQRFERKMTTACNTYQLVLC